MGSLMAPLKRSVVRDIPRDILEADPKPRQVDSKDMETEPLSDILRHQSHCPAIPPHATAEGAIE
jgi:hypothetical protein